jgi:hypothetical protein
LEKTKGDIQLVQVRVCTEIAIQCTDSDPSKRPDTQHVVDRLVATKSADESPAETGPGSSSSVSQVRYGMLQFIQATILTQYGITSFSQLV